MPSSPAARSSDGFSPYSSSDAPMTVESVLSQSSAGIKVFLTSSVCHPLWEPPSAYEGATSWQADEIPTLERLGMPAIVSGRSDKKHKPDMLLYLLGRLQLLDDTFPARLRQLTTGTDHLYITNASGTGKTRILFETLAAHWGFYFSCTASPRVDPYGSLDLHEALTGIRSTSFGGAPFCPAIPAMQRLSPSWKQAAEHNRRIADLQFDRVILGRLLVFDHFLQLVAETGVDDDTARMKWLVLQLRSMALLNTDIFSSMLSVVDELEHDEVVAKIDALYQLHQPKIVFVAVDESNVAMQQHVSAFTTANHRRRVPVLRQLVHCMANRHPASRLLVAGTLFDEEVVSEPIRASRSTSRSLRVFHELGHFDSFERTAGYLRHFFADKLSPADCKMAYTWFRGRHRILAVFVMYTLIYGASRATQVLDTLVEYATGYKRPGVNLLDDVNIGLILHDSTIEECSLAHPLRNALMNFALHQRPTEYTVDAKELVGMSVGLYGGRIASVRVFEPLVMLNLARWLSKSARYGIHGMIQSGSTDRTYSMDGASFVEGLASCLRDIFTHSPVPALRLLLDFAGGTAPWAEQSARLVLPRLSHRRLHFAAYSSSSDICVDLASSPEDLFQWLANASRPFLIPDPSFGAALLFVLELADKRRLLVCLDGQFLRLRAGSRVLRDSAMVPLQSHEFYKRDPTARERLFAALNKFYPENPRTRDAPISKTNILNLVCFSGLTRAGTSYDPPAAIIKLPFLLHQPRPAEFEMTHVLNTINRV